MAKAKEMQSGNFAMSSLKEEVNKLAYENLQKGVTILINVPFNIIANYFFSRSEERGFGSM